MTQAGAVAEQVDLAEYIRGFAGRSEYVETHLGRLIRTLELTPRGTDAKRVLEMGAYMQITPALQTRLGYGSVVGCYLGPAGQRVEKHVRSSEGEEFSCPVDLFNAEVDRYPYEDGSLDTVICCELFEHLAEDPMHLVFEVNRILANEGVLVLSTPNICSLRSISAVLHGYHPGLYSVFTARIGGNQTDPRHAREYAPREVEQLLRAGGFAIDHIETGPYGLTRPAEHEWVAELLRSRGAGLTLRDDCIHVVARKIGAPAERYPAMLYA
jgi:SAM-dependent methyltransferase